MKVLRSRVSGEFTRLSAIVIAIALASGIALRVYRLGSVPLGFGQDEACNGYDAYSIWRTGRDQHGEFLPLAPQAFGQYVMPLFDYSLVPLIGALGLKPSVVRLGSALWGIADLAAITAIGGLIAGWPGAAAAAALGAVSPWHLPISRYGAEVITGSATISLAMLGFLMWLRTRRYRWLWLSAVLFGVSLYSYAITKAFVPLMIGLLICLYWRELRAEGRRSLIALAIVVILALPQAVMMVSNPAMQAEFNDTSLLRSLVRGQPSGQGGTASSSRFIPVENLGAAWASYLTRSYLFLTGDRGDHWTLLHPRGFGQLLPEQAVLSVLALIAFASRRRRRLAILLLAWLVIANVPAALTVPLGAKQPEPRVEPSAWVMFDHATRSVPMTPALLLAHPDSRHGVLAVAPWILLSALGLLVLCELAERRPLVGAAAIAILSAGVVFHGARFVRSYFRDYPIEAAPYFQYGMGEVVNDVERLSDGAEPVVITPNVNQPFIYVLFFERYPPRRFQHEPVVRAPGLWGTVLHFDRYWFVSPELAYGRLAHGVFVFSGRADPGPPPARSIDYPDGRPAYTIFVK